VLASGADDDAVALKLTTLTYADAVVKNVGRPTVHVRVATMSSNANCFARESVLKELR
jgi:hypothetical protein